MESTQIFHEIQAELRSVVKIISQLTESVGNIVAAFEKLTQADLPRPTAKRAPVRKKVVVKNGVVEKIKRVPATQIVFDFIKKSDQGLDTAALMRASGYNQRKIHNVVFRLKKQGKIIKLERGVYKKK